MKLSAREVVRSAVERAAKKILTEIFFSVPEFLFPYPCWQALFAGEQCSPGRQCSPGQ